MMTQEKRTSLAGVLVVVGLLAMVAMALLNLFIDKADWMRYAFTAGAVLVLAGRLVGKADSASLRVRRLHRILIISALLYCASAAMMFIPDGANNWIAFLLAGVVIQMYASWMIDREEKKEK